MRIEKDHFGMVEIPEDVLWGIHTERALANFPISGNTVSSELIAAIAEIKKSAIQVNGGLGFVDKDVVDAVVQACNELLSGAIVEPCPLPALQGGAGTSTNMYVNEVVANRTLQILGKSFGDYDTVHPIETINLHQSTNDVFPTAVKMVVIRKLRVLSEKIAELQGELQKKEQEFSDVIMIGRTELQDAVPMTMGAQFATFAQAAERDRWRCFKAEERIRMVNIGGTAIGTGLTAPRGYIFRVIEKLREETGLPIGRAEHIIDATANVDSFTEVGATLQANAVNLIKIARDLRYLHSTGEIELPQLQAGSSIMPGKVNPVIAESVIQLALKAKSETALLADVTALGTLQINEFMPLLADTIFSIITALTDAVAMLSVHVVGIEVNRERCEENLFKGTSVITAFLPLLGYSKAEELVDFFVNDSKRTDFKVFLVEELGEDVVSQYLDPMKLMALGYRS